MLNTLADFMIALLDLVEAEIKLARRGVVVLVAVLIIGFISGLTILGALGLLTWAFYSILSRVMAQPGALTLCALTLLIIAGLSICYARKLVR
jgi:hypothetical protein